MTLKSRDVDFSMSFLSTRIYILLESIASQKIQNSFHALAWMLVNKRNCILIAGKKRTLLNSDFSFIGDRLLPQQDF